MPATTTITDEAAFLLREIASPGIPGESVKAAIGRAARKSGLAYGRIRRIWYGLAVIEAQEMDKIRSIAAVRTATCEKEQAKREEAGRDELREVITRLERIEEALVLIASNNLRPLANRPRS